METQLLILYDGDCGLCDHAVQWLLKHDKKSVFLYAPLQGTTAQEVMARHHLPEGLDSILFVRKNETKESIFWYSNAAIEIAKELHWPWKILAFSVCVPKFFRDGVYRLIARHRLRFFGKADSCQLPTAEIQQRFLP